MTDEKDTKDGVNDSRDTLYDARDPLADVRLRRPGDRFRDEELSAREQRRVVSYGRARGRL